MKSMNLFALELQMNNKEKELDNLDYEYNLIKEGYDRGISSLKETKDENLYIYTNKIQKIIDSSQGTLQYLYVLLIRYAKVKANILMIDAQLSRNNYILKLLNTIMKLNEDLLASYKEAVSKLEQVKGKLLDEYGNPNYLEFNHNFNQFNSITSNYEFIEYLDNRDNDEENIKIRNTNKKLIDFIKTDNEFSDEISKIEKMISKFSKLLEKIPNEIDKIKYRITQRQNIIDGLIELQGKCEVTLEENRDKIEEILNEKFDNSYYEDRLREKEAEIRSINLDISDLKDEISNKKYEIIRLKSQLEANKDRANSLSRYAKDRELDIIRRENNNINKSITYFSNGISYCENKIISKKGALSRKGMQATRIIDEEYDAEKAFRKIRTDFKRDYKKVDNLVLEIVTNAVNAVLGGQYGEYRN